MIKGEGQTRKEGFRRSQSNGRWLWRRKHFSWHQSMDLAVSYKRNKKKRSISEKKPEKKTEKFLKWIIELLFQNNTMRFILLLL